MKLEVACELEYFCDEDLSLITMLCPQNGPQQTVIKYQYELAPSLNFTYFNDVYGNSCQRVNAPKGHLKISTKSTVNTHQTDLSSIKMGEQNLLTIPSEVLMYLLPSRYCESDRFLSMAAEITQDLPNAYLKAVAVRNFLAQNFTYEYGYTNSSTSAVDFNYAGIGVCRDFSHLGIALCRAINLPARMVVGYLHELKPMDLHAWYEVFIDQQWHIFDATQQKPDTYRVVLAYGRDAADVAFATQYGSAQLLSMQVSVRPLTDQ